MPEQSHGEPSPIEFDFRTDEEKAAEQGWDFGEDTDSVLVAGTVDVPTNHETAWDFREADEIAQDDAANEREAQGALGQELADGIDADFDFRTAEEKASDYAASGKEERSALVEQQRPVLEKTRRGLGAKVLAYLRR